MTLKIFSFFPKGVPSLLFNPVSGIIESIGSMTKEIQALAITLGMDTNYKHDASRWQKRKEKLKA